MEGEPDFAHVIQKEQELFENIRCIGPHVHGSQSELRAIYALYLDNLRDLHRRYSRAESEIGEQIEMLKKSVSVSLVDNDADLAKLVMLLVQVRRISHDHFAHIKAELETIISQAQTDLQTLPSLIAGSPAYLKAGNEILQTVPVASCVEQCVATDAITAITAYMNNCLSLAFKLANRAGQKKARSLELLGADDSSTAKLVLIERQALLSTIASMIETCSVLVRTATWFADYIERDISVIICCNDLRMPPCPRSEDILREDFARSSAFLECSGAFCNYLNATYVERDEQGREWSFDTLPKLTLTDSGYEALIRKVSGLVAGLRKQKSILGEHMLAGDIENCATLTAEISRQEEKVANLVSFGHDLHEQLYTLPQGLAFLRNRLSTHLLTLRRILEDSTTGSASRSPNFALSTSAPSERPYTVSDPFSRLVTTFL